MNKKAKKKKRILVYRLGSLGDTIIVLPCFHKIKEAFPEGDITLLTNRPIAAKAAPGVSIIGNSFFSRQLDYPVGTRSLMTLLKLIWQIRKLKIDTLINVSAARSERAAVRDKWFFRLAGIQTMIGFPENREDFHLVMDATTGKYEWEAFRLARRIKALGNLELHEDKYWDLLLSSEEHQRARDLIQDVTMPMLAVSPGTKLQAKDWGKDNWIELLTRLGQHLSGFRLIIIGAADEKETGQEFGKAWGNNYINLCGAASPRESAAVLQYAKLFIGHDSGPMHLASAVGVPCIGIFSARILPGQWYPRGEDNIIIYHQTDCAGCGLETCIVEKRKCILSITVNEVYCSAKTILNRNCKEQLSALSY